MNKIDLEKFIIGLSKIQLQCTHNDVKLKDVINMALDSQNLQVDDDFELSVIQDKPKFEKGDWIVRKDGTSFGPNSDYVLQIINTTINKTTDGSYKYMYWISWCEYICDCVDDFRKWTLEDAKDGDVLAFDDETIIIFKDLYNSTTFHTYCHIEDGEFGISRDDMPDWWEGTGFHPATKEQRDILFKKMKEAGYKWDTEKKELINEIDEPFDDLELALYDWLSSDTWGAIPQRQMRRTVKARAKEIREKLR